MAIRRPVYWAVSDAELPMYNRQLVNHELGKVSRRNNVKTFRLRNNTMNRQAQPKMRRAK